jgi:hypothetical protein
MDDDEYDVYDDFSEFTEEDFARIDASTAQKLATTSVNGGPAITVALEQPVVDNFPLKAPAEQPMDPSQHLSPIQHFRRGQILSVTDLVAPAWCAHA